MGRGRELELLVSTLGRVREERSAQLVTLVGVPGIGKSRLVSELLRTVEEGTALVRWRQGRSLPYGDGVTFWALAEIIKAEAGILESDTAERADEKLTRAVGQSGVEASETQWVERHLRPLVGSAEAEIVQPGEGAAAWRRYLESLAEQRPTVLVFEDLHWADDAMLDFVDQLVGRSGGVPLLVLGTARPELLQRRPGWGGGKPNALTISLSPLSTDETGRLLQSLLEQTELEAQVQEELLARAGGNPLYAEQYARSLLERGEVLELPETVQGIIAARLDALSDEEKRLLQDAAVVGKVFWLGALEAVDGVTRWQAEELLHALEQKEFVQRSRSSSVASEGEYAFRHLLIRDVAYGQIPRAARSQKHQRAAAWIESLGRPEEQAELLAHHYLQALELAEAAGLDAAGLNESARHALRDAGDRAAALYAAETAQRFYDAALRLWPEQDPERAQLLYRRSVLGAEIGGGDPERLAEARDALLVAGDNGKAAEAEMLISNSFWMQGRRESAAEHAERAIALLADAQPSRSVVSVLLRQASRAELAGQYERALELATQTRALADQLGWEHGLSEALGLVGISRLNMGDRAGLEDIAQSVEVAAAAGAFDALARAYNLQAVAQQMVGDLNAGFAARLEGERVAVRMGSAAYLRWFKGVLVDHRYRRGEWDEALRAADEFIAEIEAGSPHYGSFQVYAVRAEMRSARGDTAGAIRDAERALAAGRSLEDPQALFFVLAGCTHVFVRESESDRATRVSTRVPGRTGPRRRVAVRRHQPAGLRVRPRSRSIWSPSSFAALAGQLDTPWTEAVRAYAQGDFAAAASTLHRTGSRPEEAEARRRAAEQLASAGRPAEADQQLQEALAFYRSVNATRCVRECETLLAALQALD